MVDDGGGACVETGDMTARSVDVMFDAFDREFLGELRGRCAVDERLFDRDGVADVNRGDDVTLRV